MTSITKCVGRPFCLNSTRSGRHDFHHCKYKKGNRFLSSFFSRPFAHFSNESIPQSNKNSVSIFPEFESKQFAVSCKNDGVLPSEFLHPDTISPFDKNREVLKRKLLVKTMSVFAYREDFDRRLQSLKALNLTKMTACNLNSVLKLLAVKPDCLSDWKLFVQMLFTPLWQLQEKHKLKAILFPSATSANITLLNLEKWLRVPVASLLEHGLLGAYEEVFSRLAPQHLDCQQAAPSLSPSHSLLEHHNALLLAHLCQRFSASKKEVQHFLHVSSPYVRHLDSFSHTCSVLLDQNISFSQLSAMPSLVNGSPVTIEALLHDPLLHRLLLRPNRLKRPSDILRKAPALVYVPFPLLKQWVTLLDEAGVDHIPLEKKVVDTLKKDLLNVANDMLQVIKPEDLQSMNKVELFSMFNRPHLLPSLISKTEAEEAEVRGGDEVGIGVYMPHKPHPFRGPQPLDVSLLNKILGCIDPTAKPVTIDPESGMLVGVKKIQNQRIYRMTKDQQELISFLKKELKPTRAQVLEIHAALRKVKFNDAAFILKALYNHGFTPKQVLHGFEIFTYDKEVVLAHLAKMPAMYENYEQVKEHFMGVNFVILAMERSKNFNISKN